MAARTEQLDTRSRSRNTAKTRRRVKKDTARAARRRARRLLQDAPKRATCGWHS